jgi:tripartite-type tricarboxylate transporter receptor subunit TctC
MSMLADLPVLIGFFSYSRDDDEDSGGRLSKLRERIQAELRGQLGRTRTDFKLWQDKAAIAHGELWEDRIKSAIAESAFFIPIITPTAIRSYHCKFEFDAFLAREKELGRNNLVFPILYIPVPALADGRWRQDPLLATVGSRQYEDWQHLRHLDPSSSSEFALRIDKFCANVVRAMHQPWLSPQERREAEARQREEDEHRQQEKIEQAEARRRDGEQHRLEEERRRAAEEEERRKRAQRSPQMALEAGTTIRKRWGLIAGATALLLLVSSIGIYQTGLLGWFPWTPADRPAPPDRNKAAADAEAQRKAEEAEQQRQAALKADAERKAAADAERKAQEAEQQRQAALKADAERKAAADAEAQRKAAAGVAQTYPARPVRIVVPFPPGGATDVVGRLVGQSLSERLGQPFIVENQPGGGGNIGTEAVVRALPDGYTSLLVSTSTAINATLYDKLQIRDIAPVASISRAPLIMAVHPSVAAKTVPEFIAYAKANRGRISFASSGNGTLSQLAGELFKMMAGIEMVHVPYRGSAPALVDLFAGQVLPHIRAGRLRALAVTTATRWEALPDIPPLSDFVAGYEATSWWGVGTPNNVPAEIVDKLNKEVNASLVDPKMKARLADLGLMALPRSPTEFGKLIADETEKWARVIKFAGIKR